MTLAVLRSVHLAKVMQIGVGLMAQGISDVRWKERGRILYSLRIASPSCLKIVRRSETSTENKEFGKALPASTQGL